MNEKHLPVYEPDEATLARDDALLDALGSGARLPGEDTLAMALFMWRDDLSAPPKAVAVQQARRKRRLAAVRRSRRALRAARRKGPKWPA